MSKITTIIVGIGENSHLEECITSALSLSHEVVLLDMGISAQNIEKCQGVSGLRIEKINPVSHVELIREDSKKYATTDYILFLDPDEVLQPKLVELIRSQYESYDTIKIPRKNIIMSKWIEHARWWPDYQIRVFKKDAAIWPTEIHKQPEIKGTELILEPLEELSIIHYNYETLDEFLSKMLRYAKAEAMTKFEKKEMYTLAQALKDGTNEFISRYFAGDGFKDGMHGFVLSFLQLMYYPLVNFYMWEMGTYEKVEDKEIIHASETFPRTLLQETVYWLNSKSLSNSSSQIKNRILQKLLK